MNTHARAKGGGEEGKISLAHERSPNTVWFTRLACIQFQTCALYLHAHSARVKSLSYTTTIQRTTCSGWTSVQTGSVCTHPKHPPLPMGLQLTPVHKTDIRSSIPTPPEIMFVGILCSDGNSSTRPITLQTGYFQCSTYTIIILCTQYRTLNIYLYNLPLTDVLWVTRHLVVRFHILCFVLGIPNATKQAISKDYLNVGWPVCACVCACVCVHVCVFMYVGMCACTCACGPYVCTVSQAYGQCAYVCVFVRKYACGAVAWEELNNVASLRIEIG